MESIKTNSSTTTTSNHRLTPEWRKTLLFYKDGDGWFADVKGHTQAQNRMVAGADKMIEQFAAGHNAVCIVLSAIPHESLKDMNPLEITNARPIDDRYEDTYIVKMKRIEHDMFGATYWVTQFGMSDEDATHNKGLFESMAYSFINAVKGAPVWICNVTHTVFGGEHPDVIFMHSIEPLDITEKPTIIVDPEKAAGRY